MDNKLYVIKCRSCFHPEARINTRKYTCNNCKNPEAYGHGWGKANKQVRLRDKVCQICGVNKRLHVHHKDRNRKNHNLDNLILYCHFCHLSQHGKNFEVPIGFKIGKYGTRLFYTEGGELN